MSDNRLSRARAYVRRGLGVDGDSPELLALKGELVESPAPVQHVDYSPPPPPPPTSSSRTDGEPVIKGESPAELARRIASWFQ